MSGRKFVQAVSGSIVALTRDLAKLHDIEAKLATLRARDPDFRLFCARAHRYQLGPVLKEDQLSGLEQEFGATLPDGYRTFLLHIGNGGAGPYYGLFPLAGGDPEDLTDFNSIKDPFPWKDKNLRPRRVLPGALYICNYGCALRFVLIVTGQCRGEVWHDWRADSAGIYPATNPRGDRLHFLEWYSQWLDDRLTNPVDVSPPGLR